MLAWQCTKLEAPSARHQASLWTFSPPLCLSFSFTSSLSLSISLSHLFSYCLSLVFCLFVLFFLPPSISLSLSRRKYIYISLSLSLSLSVLSLHTSSARCHQSSSLVGGWPAMGTPLLRLASDILPVFVVGLKVIDRTAYRSFQHGESGLLVSQRFWFSLPCSYAWE